MNPGMFDRFFGRSIEPEPEPEPEVTRADLVRKLHAWDGKPVIRLTMDESISLWSFVPHWTSYIVGPRLPWVGQHASVEVDYLVVPTYEDAEVAALEKAHEMCVSEGMLWDPEEWKITRLALSGGN